MYTTTNTDTRHTRDRKSNFRSLTEISPVYWECGEEYKSDDRPHQTYVSKYGLHHLQVNLYSFSEATSRLCDSIWNQHYAIDSNALENVQCRATELVPELRIHRQTETSELTTPSILKERRYYPNIQVTTWQALMT